MRTIDKDVAAIKQSRDWEAKFMLMKEMMEEERSEGKAEGISEGINIGRSEGINIGTKKGTKRILKALQLLKSDMHDETIMDITGISAGDLQTLKEMAFAT